MTIASMYENGDNSKTPPFDVVARSAESGARPHSLQRRVNPRQRVLA